MHPDIDKLITLALADGEVTEKEREIILRKAEKLGLDIDEVEMYLEGKISNHETVISQETKPTATPKTSTREFVPKIVQHLKPAVLDRDSTFKEKILELKSKNKIISEEVGQLKENVNTQFHVLKNNLELEINLKTNNYIILFLEKANPKLMNNFNLQLKSNDERVNDILLKNNFTKLKTDKTVWDNYRLKKNKGIKSWMLMIYVILLFAFFIYLTFILGVSPNKIILSLHLIWVLFIPLILIIPSYYILYLLGKVSIDFNIDKVFEDKMYAAILEKIISDVNFELENIRLEINSIDNTLKNLQMEKESILRKDF